MSTFLVTINTIKIAVLRIIINGYNYQDIKKGYHLNNSIFKINYNIWIKNLIKNRVFLLKIDF